ncbi:hypothetical protein TI05_11625 [Achromatium sp. WMS3]|nr:hypothetical protein TI05_11625 [Achromatium sp. WMS3]
MFNDNQKQVAIKFAESLSQRKYDIAYSMCSKDLQSKSSVDEMKNNFEQIIPTNWGNIDPIEIVDNNQFPFIYIVLGGDIYSESIIISSFISENNEIKINEYELGRP